MLRYALDLAFPFETLHLWGIALITNHDTISIMDPENDTKYIKQMKDFHKFKWEFSVTVCKIFV